MAAHGNVSRSPRPASCGQQSGCAAKIFEAIRAAIAAAWPPGLRDEHARDTSHRFVLAGSPWEPHSDADTAAARRLVTAVVEAVLRVGFNVVACVHLQGGSGAGAQGAAAHEGAPHAVSSASASAPADRPSQSIPDTWIFQHALDPDLVPMPSFSRNDMQPLVCCAVDSADSLSLHAGPAELAESLASDLAAVWPQGVRLVAGSTPTIRFNGAPWRGIGEDSVHCRRLLLAVIASMARSGRRLVASAQISAVWSTPSLVFEASSDPPPRSSRSAARLCAVSLVETATLRLIPAHDATDDAADSSGDGPHTHAAARAVDAALAACGISASKSHFVGVPEWSLKAMDWTASGAPAAAARGLVLSLLEAMHAAGWRIVASCRVTSRADQCDTLVFGRSAKARKQTKKKLMTLIDRAVARQTNKRDTAAASDAEVTGHALHALVLSLSHGLESLRRQLHEQHAAGEALRADLAARTDANAALRNSNDALRTQNEELRRTFAALEAEESVQLECAAELQARVGSLETLAERLQVLVEPVSQPSPEPPAAPAHPAVVMLPMRFNAGATNLWDRLPDDVRTKIMDASDHLTKIVNGLLHPLEVKKMPKNLAVALWLDVIKTEWPGDLRKLPPPPSGYIEYDIRTRSMLMRLRELGVLNPNGLNYSALLHRWDDLAVWDNDSSKAMIAALSGRIDILSDLFDGPRPPEFSYDLFACSLAAAQFDTFVWLAKLKQRRYPNFDIPPYMFDKEIHALLRNPFRNAIVCETRIMVLLCPEFLGHTTFEKLGEASDLVTLKIAHKHFGGSHDFSKISYRTLETLEWAHSHGFIRDVVATTRDISRWARDVKVAQWARKHLGAVFDKTHLSSMSSPDNTSMILWMLAQLGNRVDDDIILTLISNVSVWPMNVLIARDPTLAARTVDAVAKFAKDFAELTKGYGIDFPRAEFLDWLYARHPSGFTHKTLNLALEAAIKKDYVDTVKFLLDKVTTVDWDLVAAWNKVENSKARKQTKKKLMTLIDRAVARRASSKK
ncbi:hypothetical protein HK105_205661 [Polyrhizophydium stewartii]|uniref:Uncharacterized protein n=1 Tax=Polyrhizophydium stewartii TaxID=2732419 RepID=A0ABR4N5E2_9FUNG